MQELIILGELAKRAKMVSNWLLGEFTRLLNATNTEIDSSRVTPPQLCQLLDFVDKGTVSGTSAKAVFEEMFNTGKSPSTIISEKGLGQISDSAEIEQAVARAIEANPQAVADFKSYLLYAPGAPDRVQVEQWIRDLGG